LEDQEAALIEIWSEKWCLYDLNSRSHSNKSETRKAVEVIAKKLGFTANAANKITSLHTQFLGSSNHCQMLAAVLKKLLIYNSVFVGIMMSLQAK